ncbi:MAG TPA: hypothetical protein VN700_00600 [Vicinamibacterales bacterium]|nr:hypothetical protein [Vicinamibacterales bacterium]
MAEDAPETRPRPSIPFSVSPALLLVLAIFLVVSFVVFDQIEEDAFIYYRVAENIADGHGYVFNSSGERIEAGSSILWQAMLALVALLPVNIILASKIMGLAFGAGTLYSLHKLSLVLIRSGPLRLMPALLLAVSIPFYCWSQRGLETPLYVFAIVTLGMWLLHPRLKHFWMLPALAVILSRSEGVIVLLGLAGFFVVERRTWPRLARGLALVGVVIAASVVWRYYYFHDLMPHAIYVKAQGGSGVADSWAWLSRSGLWLMAVVAAVGLASRLAWHPGLVIIASLEAPFIVWAFVTGDGFKPYNRHLVPALPLFYVLLGCGLDRVAARRGWRLVIPAAAAGAVAWVLFFAPAGTGGGRVTPNVFSQELTRIAAGPPEFWRSVKEMFSANSPAIGRPPVGNRDSATRNWQASVGDFIARRYRPGTVVVYDQMGQTPWYAGADKVFIDTLGLTYRPAGLAVFNHDGQESQSSSYLAYTTVANALLRQTGRDDFRRWDLPDAVNHIFELNPDVIILNRLITGVGTGSLVWRRREANVSGLIARDPRLTQRYAQLDPALVSREVPWRASALLSVYERNDLRRGRPIE